MRHRRWQCPHCSMELGIVRPSSGGGNYLETTSAVVIARIADGVDITCRCGAVTTWLGDEVKWKLTALARLEQPS